MSGDHNPRKFIIDTDPGVDDAMAIFMALEAHRRGDIEILAFTLVTGNCHVDYQPTNMLRILKLVPEIYGQIPVYVGAHEGLVHKFVHPTGRDFHGVDGFCDVQFEDRPMDDPKNPIIGQEHAALAITRLVCQFPDQISIIALGPLTNIALAMNFDKTFVKRVQYFYVMGGNMEGLGNVTTTAEFNFYADPEAAHLVLRKLGELGEVKTAIVTFELCKNNFYPWDWRQNVLGQIGGNRIWLLNRLEDVQRTEKNHYRKWAIFDQIAVAVALDRKCITKSTEYRATVELQGLYSRGQMIMERRFLIDGKNSDKNLNLEVIEEVDKELVEKYIIQGMSDPESSK